MQIDSEDKLYYKSERRENAIHIFMNARRMWHVYSDMLMQDLCVSSLAAAFNLWDVAEC